MASLLLRIPRPPNGQPCLRAHRSRIRRFCFVTWHALLWHWDASAAPSYRTPGRGYAIEEFDKIFQILRAATGIDFRHYKQSSVVRRILRQMALQGIKTLAQYAMLCGRTARKRSSLADHIFVPFTQFLSRSRKVFRPCEAHIRPKLRSKRRTEPVRVWVAGCSTGEEVYSLAMLLVEELGPRANRTAVQLFGTDIRERALQYARAGVYPEAAVADVSPARLKRFFIKSEGGYRISQALRDCVSSRGTI